MQNILAKNLLVITCGFLCWYAWAGPWHMAALKILTSSQVARSSSWMVSSTTKPCSAIGSFKERSVRPEEPL